MLGELVQPLPSRSQFKRWSLPIKWSFWAAVLGIAAGIGSLVPGLLSLLSVDQEVAAERRVLLQAAQELRYNDKLLTALALALQSKSRNVPVGTLKTDALMTLVSNDCCLV